MLLRPAASLALLALFTTVGCYRVRIGESFWLHPRPGPAADSAAAARGLPDAYALTRIAIPVADGVQPVGLAATRPDAKTTILFFGGDDFVAADAGAGTLRALTTAAPVNVILVDYPGTGLSSGHPSLGSLNADARARAFALCLHNGGYEVSLEPRKIYEVLPDREAAEHQQLRVIDESGEDYVYPSSLFASITLPQSIRRAVIAAM